MPTAKKTTAPKAAAKKKAPAKKKAAPKKVAPKKVTAPKAAAPAPPAPVKKFDPVSVYLLTNAGEYTIGFTDESKFKAAMLVIESAPSKPSGGRSTPTYAIDTGSRQLTFQLVEKYQIKS
tara:strand:- start:1263 stop:1622 length:360 start_codon:yes stop_codon:yes gene_type:complete